MNETTRLLVIDDEEAIRRGCTLALEKAENLITAVESGEDGIEELKKSEFDVVLLDLMLPGMDGFSVLKWIKKNRPRAQTVVMTGYATIERAVEAMREGAYDFVAKPFSPEYLRIVVGRATQAHDLLNETSRLRQEKAQDLFTIVQEQSRLKTVFNCMEGAVLVTNHAGTVVLHNPAAIKVLELRADPVIGKPVAAVLSNQTALEMIDEVTRNMVSVSREFEPGTVSRQHLRASCAPVRTASGKLFGAVTVFEDITAQKKMDQLRSEFAAAMAHELRAPLASIEQMILAAKYVDGKEETTDPRGQLLARIQTRVQGLQSMVGNLLRLSRLESGATVYNMEPSHGNDILEEAVDLMRPRAEAKNIDLRLETPAEVVWINVDREQMQGVFANIIDNAIKYSPEGGHVSVAMRAVGGMAVIEFRDTGIGIEAKHLPHLFDRFFRVRDKATRGITGTGLGLSLAKKIVDGHAGFIDVTSQPGQGTQFTINLPLSDPPANRIVAKP